MKRSLLVSLAFAALIAAACSSGGLLGEAPQATEAPAPTLPTVAPGTTLEDVGLGGVFFPTEDLEIECVIYVGEQGPVEPGDGHRCAGMYYPNSALPMLQIWGFIHFADSKYDEDLIRIVFPGWKTLTHYVNKNSTTGAWGFQSVPDFQGGWTNPLWFEWTNVRIEESQSIIMQSPTRGVASGEGGVTSRFPYPAKEGIEFGVYLPVPGGLWPSDTLEIEPTHTPDDS